MSMSKELMSNFVTLVSLSPEERLYHIQLLGKPKCPFCGEPFETIDEVIRHIQEEHPHEDPEELKLK